VAFATTAAVRRDELTATPLTGTFGALVHGADLARSDAAQADAVAALLDQYKVLVFRDQHAVGPHELLAFSSGFGAPETADHPSHPNYPGLPGVKVLKSDVSQRKYLPDSWHTDGATRERTRCVTVLQAVDIPAYGRDTLFADMEIAYDELSEAMKAFLGPFVAEHSWGPAKPDAPPVAHPLIHTHAATGRKAIYANRLYTRRILGLTDTESRLILEYLLTRTHVPEYQLRVAWAPGTIVMWDNERTQHYLVYDHDYPRVMHRCMMF
jgi:taurine dioxygenase